MQEKYAIILTTCANQEQAAVISKALLKERLAAGIQAFPISKHDIWKDSLHVSAEVLLVMRSKRGLFSQIEELIQGIQEDAGAEILLLPIAEGAAGYLAWLEQACR